MMIRKGVDLKKSYVSTKSNKSKDLSRDSKLSKDITTIKTDESKYEDINKGSEIISELKNFENLRGILFQWVAMNAYIKHAAKTCGEKVDTDFFDRFLQLIEAQDKLTDIRLSLMREEAIKELETVLQIEHKTLKDIGRFMEDLHETLEIIENYLENTLKKVYIGENIVIQVEDFNKYLDMCTQLLSKMTINHEDAFQESKENEAKLKELNSLILEEINLIKSILLLLESKSVKRMDDNMEKYSDIQNKRIENLKIQLTQQL